MSLIARLIWLLSSIVIGALLLRFFFLLFGANPLNGFVEFIYDFSGPFVRPFVGIFSERDVVAGDGYFSLATLVALIVYTLLASVLTRLFAPSRLV